MTVIVASLTDLATKVGNKGKIENNLTTLKLGDILWLTSCLRVRLKSNSWLSKKPCTEDYRILNVLVALLQWSNGIVRYSRYEIKDKKYE